MKNNSTDVVKLLEELLKLKLQHYSGQLKETHKIKIIKKDIARIKMLNSK